MSIKIRTATKQIEKRIIKIANELKSNPYKILPECAGDCASCYFDKLKKEIDKLKNERYCERIANKKGFLSALASTILLSNQKIPHVAFIRIGNENVYYAKRGKVEDELLMSIQNWDKPNLRLIAYQKIAKKKKLNLFSLPDKIICSKSPPEEFLNFLQKKFFCDEKEYILIKWREKEIKCCGEKNTVAEMKQYFYYPDFEKEIEMDAKVNTVKCANKCEDCVIKDAIEQEVDYTQYLKGGISDKKFLDNYRKKILWKIEKKKVLILSNRCYGNNVDKFLEELKPREWEKEAINEILKYENKAVIIEQPSSAKLLEKYGVNIQKLREEYYENKKREKLKNLPVIEGDELAKFIDNLARIYRMEGKEGVLKTIKEEKMDVKKKSISYSFLYALNVKGEEWKYTKMEKEFGEHLSIYVRKLFETEGEEYKKILEEMLREIG